MLLTGRLDLPAGFSCKTCPTPTNGRRCPSLVNSHLDGGAATTCRRRSCCRSRASTRRAGCGPVSSPAGSGRAGRRGTCTWPPSAPWATAPARTASASTARPFQHDRRTIFETPTLDAARRRSGPRCAAGSACSKASNSSSGSWSGLPRAERLDRHRQQAICRAERPEVAGGVRRRTGRCRGPWTATARTSSACRC